MTLREQEIKLAMEQRAKEREIRMMNLNKFKPIESAQDGQSSEIHIKGGGGVNGLIESQPSHEGSTGVNPKGKTLNV